MADHKYHVVKYDVMSLVGDASYEDMAVAAPDIISSWDTRSEAVAARDALGSQGETIDVKLRNGSHYAGPRFVFSIAEDM